MATKAAYLTALAGLSYIEEVGTPVLDDGESNSELKYNIYDVWVLERNNGTGVSVKHRFAVYDEGGGSEEVLTTYVPSFEGNYSGYNALITEIESISNIKSYWIRQISTEQQFAIVRAMIYVTDHVEVKWYLIYKDGDLTYAEITNPEDF